MNDSYLTLSHETEDEYTVQKSRFIGSAFPCHSEEAATTYIQKIKSQYRDANHHCYAYIIGENMGIMRYSDDGEPGGTAGQPILSVIKGASIVNCCIIVTRFFGGLLLGTGGLVRAYTQAAQNVLKAAGIIRMEMTCRDLCEVPYTVWDKTKYELEKLPVSIKDISYGTAVSFSLLTRKKDRDIILRKLTDATGRQMDYLPDGEAFEAWPAE